MIGSLSPYFKLYMWITAYLLILIFTIIFIAKLIQYFQRWGFSKAQGYNYEEKNVELAQSNLSVPIHTICLKEVVKSKKVLIITPFTSSSKRFLYFATAVALQKYEVTLVESRKILKSIRKNNLDERQTTLELISAIEPDVVIAADTFFPLLLPEMESKSEKKFVFLRPLIHRSQLSLIRTFPVTSRWFYVVTMRLNKIRNLLPNQRDIKMVYKRIQSNTLIIWPKKPNRNIYLNEISNPKQIIAKSRFSFRDKETIVFAKILQFIGDASS